MNSVTRGSRIAYLRVSTLDQSVESQRAQLLELAGAQGFDQEFTDEGVSGGVPAAQRPGFGKMLAFLRTGDVLYVAAVDRLGRDAIDVQQTCRSLIDKGVTIHVRGLGAIARGAGEIVLAVLAQVADMERHRIAERTAAGRATAAQALLATGLTHRGKTSLGRPLKADSATVNAFRIERKASIAETAAHFGISPATVKRYAAAAKLSHPAFR